MMDSYLEIAVLKLHTEGRSLAEIAEQLKVDAKRANRALNRAINREIIAKQRAKKAGEPYTGLLGKVAASPSEKTVKAQIREAEIAIRDNKVREMYASGMTLDAIGKELSVTRERVRQILSRALAREAGIDPEKWKHMRSGVAIKNKLEDIKEQSKKVRDEQDAIELNEKIAEAEERGIKPALFESLHTYLVSSGISLTLLERHRPDIVAFFKRPTAKRWARFYDYCRMCGTVSVKHKMWGYCQNCVSKSPEFKEIQRASHYRNIEKVRERNAIYFNKPEVKARMAARAKEKQYGGNRSRALERDEWKCRDCGMTNQASLRKYGRELNVVRADRNRENNALENLVTLCKGCTSKRFHPLLNRG